VLINFSKYQALQNDFLVIEAGARRLSAERLGRLAAAACDRRTGVGADGILYLGSSRKADCRADVYNADGSWAEKSGNGLRIVGLHQYLKEKSKRRCSVEMAGEVSEVRIGRRDGDGYMIATDLGVPAFQTDQVPVKSRQQFMIQAPLKLGGMDFPVTCLSVGNPHTVLFVEDFEFDWQAVGHDIEHHRAFPERTNVEFVRVVNRHKIRVADWERGAGATGSSGTGAAAAVAAGVMIGALDRECEVVFEPGSLMVNWHDETGLVELTGPVTKVCEGTFDFS